MGRTGDRGVTDSGGTGGGGSRRGLRRGFTTGACAAAAAKAALMGLLGRRVDTVDIGLPVGVRASFAVAGTEAGDGWCRCSVVKDGGDDPDVTHGAEIMATVSWRPGGGVLLDRGEGVGVITKPGLELPAGEPAVNPVPRRMLLAALAEAAGAARAGGGLTLEPLTGRRYRIEGGVPVPETVSRGRPAAPETVGPVPAASPAEAAEPAGGPEPGGRGLLVVVSCPDGEERARRTLNARLGIVGGISILGTRGIVIPYSTAAYRASVARALDVARAAGVERVVLTTGGRSEGFARRLLPALPEEAFVQMGEFLGFALREAARRGFPAVTVCGMVGKLSKAAAGHFHLHARSSQVDTVFLARVCARCGGGSGLAEAVAGANTAREAAELVQAAGVTGFFDELCRLACRETLGFIGEAGRGMRVEYVLVGFEGAVLGRAEAP